MKPNILAKLPSPPVGSPRRSHVVTDAPILAFPTPLPGEFLGSLLLRYHGIYGAKRLTHTFCETLGLGRGAVRNLPTRLGQFAIRTGSMWHGGVDEILETHTVWPVYRPFLTAYAASCAYQRIVAGPAGSLQLTLGDAASRLRLQRPLQACPDCITEDTIRWGITYLHTDHQLPGVGACFVHNASLVNVRILDRSHQGAFKVASHTHLRHVSPGEAEFARLSATLRAAHAPRLTPSLLAFAYSERLRGLDLLTSKGYVRCGALAGAVFERYPEAMLGRLGISRKAVEGWMPVMLHRLQRGHHPVKHLLYIGTLFGNIESFLEALPQRELPFSSPKTLAPRRDIGSEVAEQLRQGQISMRAIGRRLGISANSCITHAKRQGVRVEARPKWIHLTVLRRIERKAATGTPIPTICKAEHVSMSTVYRAIESNPSVGAARRAALERLRRGRCREQWQKALRRAASRPTVARRRAPAVYAWLYRHDKEWLKNNTSRRRQSAIPSNVRK